MSNPGEHSADDLPKVEKVASSQPLSRSKTLEMLSQFLMEEQERRTRLREDHNLNSTWKDLQNAYDSLAMYDAAELGLYDTFDGSTPANNNNTLANPTNAAVSASGEFSVVERLVQATRSSFIGGTTPDPNAPKSSKSKKKKKKEAKKQAKLQAKNNVKRMIDSGF